MAIRDWSLTAADNDDADGDINLVGSSASIRTGDDSMRSIMQKEAIYRDDTNGSRATGGSSNTYTYASAGSVATPADGFSAYATGDELVVQANHANTGAATLNVDSVGAKAIRKYAGSAEAALVSGDIVADSMIELRYDGDANSSAGAWILQNPARISPWEFIGESTPSGVGSVNFTDLSAYRDLRLTIYAVPASDGAALWIRTDDDNGASYDSGASDYAYQIIYANDTSIQGTGDTTASAIVLSPGVGSDTGEHVAATIELLEWNQASRTTAFGDVRWHSSSGSQLSGHVSGERNSATAQDAIRVLFSTGNIASGRVVLEGRRATF